MSAPDPPHAPEGALRAAVIAGIGSYVPPDVVTNDELTARLETSDEWIRTRTGIVTRHRITPGTATSDLAVEAGQRALKSAGASHADAVVLATTTPDQPCPATAPQVAARLDCAGAAAFDVSAVCTGFLYGLATAASLVVAGVADSVLLVAAEAFTSLVDPDDRHTAIIFGDGAGAVLLRAGTAGEPGAVGSFVLGSDGTASDLIEVPAGGSRQRSARVPARPQDTYLRMRGRDTYRHAVERMTSASRQAVHAAGWTFADVDRLAAHQANARIIAAVADRLDLPEQRLLCNVAHVGNTGAASIPLLLSEAVEAGRLTAGHRVLLTAFGGGLTWGATTLTWPDVTAG
ncbi:beta-ketoacyl-ACP synthase III [Streptomyces sp. NPDC007808]|uniref:beta-ketoacyl-ACP synthase III n=1 Tax=Streptomyces sp. NPDC007808 TaxID=3364779 RepID=UPI0036CCB79E